MRGILEKPCYLYGEIDGQGCKIVVQAGSVVEVTLDDPEERAKFKQDFTVAVKLSEEERK